jgi:hypothetical protein
MLVASSFARLPPSVLPPSLASLTTSPLAVAWRDAFHWREREREGTPQSGRRTHHSAPTVTSRSGAYIASRQRRARLYRLSSFFGKSQRPRQRSLACGPRECSLCDDETGVSERRIR